MMIAAQSGVDGGQAPAPRVEEPDGAPRIDSLDIMRGIAILGILFMNINTMGGSVYAAFGFDIRHLGWTASDRTVWAIRDVIADGTARCMLELLFGAGMMILTDRIAAGAESRWAVLRRYYWRNAVLFLFGVAHIFLLLWGGDILHTYALAAMVAVLFRRLSPRFLLAIGLLMVAVPAIVTTLGYRDAVTVRAASAAIRTRAAAGQTPTAAERAIVAKADKRVVERAARRRRTAANIAAEDQERARDFRGEASFTWRTITKLQAKGFELQSVYEALSIMLVGAALYGWGVLQGRRSRAFYAAMAVACYAVGVAIRATGTRDAFRFDDAPSIIWPLYEVGRLATTLGHVGAINLLLGTAIGARLLRPFVAAGRTALSIYICQTLICLWVLYPPWGFALYGHQSWTALMASAVVIDLGLLLLANWWVRRFRIAPVEWAWRSIVEQRRLPFRRRSAFAPEGLPQPA